MTDQVSIWRWQVEGDLDAQMAELVQADDTQFADFGAAMGGPDELALKETPAQTEAKLRAMGLPDDVLQTTLEGFRAMVEEEAEAQQIFDDDDDSYDGRGGEGRVGATLASSHMFFNDPYASLSDADITSQVDAAVARYTAALSKAVGTKGQRFDRYLGTTPEQLNGPLAYDALIAAGAEGVLWVWERGAHVFALSHWQEDRELPIDLEVHRFPAASLKALQGKF